MKAKVFTVKRSKWARKDSDNLLMGRSELLNSRGNMCCLGFVCNQLGIDEAHLERIPTPRRLLSELRKKIKDYPFLDEGFNSALSKDAMKINDNPGLPSPEKEKQLTELFKKNGLTLNFVD